MWSEARPVQEPLPSIQAGHYQAMVQFLELFCSAEQLLLAQAPEPSTQVMKLGREAVITKWSNLYEKVTFEENSGKILLEDSKATCPIGGPDCISIDYHGQKTEGSNTNSKNANEQVHSQLNPMVDMKDMTRKQADGLGLTLSK